MVSSTSLDHVKNEVRNGIIDSEIGSWGKIGRTRTVEEEKNTYGKAVLIVDDGERLVVAAAGGPKVGMVIMMLGR